MHRIILTLVFLFVCPLLLRAQEPARKAFFGVLGQVLTDSTARAHGLPGKGGLAIDSVLPAGTAAALALKKGDVLLQLNGQKIERIQDLNRAANTLRTGDAVTALVWRKSSQLTLKSKAVMRPYEQDERYDVLYDWVKFRSGYLRCIIKKPKTKAKVPAILFIPGYNCGQIENYNSGAYGKLINAWLQAGYAVMRIEKSGMGDSYNLPDCFEVDLVTDIQGYEAGLLQLKSKAYIDSARVFLFGHSMGGIIAPEVASRQRVKGVMVYATVFRPWSEFLLEMHRVQNPLLGSDFIRNEDLVRTLQKIYYEFFILRKTREELVLVPEYKALVESELEYQPGNNQMWGRHWRFWQQLDSLNLARSWKESNCKVLSIFGGADWIACSEVEHYLITELVNSYCDQCATYVRIPDIDHMMVRHKNMKVSVSKQNDKVYAEANFNTAIADETIKWLRQVN